MAKGFGSLDELRGALRDASAPIHRDARLEAAIDAAPEDAMAFAVYGDALEAAGDPRGALTALQLAGDRDAATRHLAAHEVYVLGALGTDVRAGTIALDWFGGFVRRLRLEPRPKRGRTATDDALEALDAAVKLYAFRFVRELDVLGAVAPAKIVERLAAAPWPLLTRLRTTPAWKPTKKLRARFPHLVDPATAAAATAARARGVPLVDAMDWTRAIELDAAQAAELLEPFATRLQRADVDTTVLDDSGLVACAGDRVRDLVVPSCDRGVAIVGDVTADVIEQPFRAAPVIVLGDVRCRALCTDGCFIVTGDLVVGRAVLRMLEQLRDPRARRRLGRDARARQGPSLRRHGRHRIDHERWRRERARLAARRRERDRRRAACSTLVTADVLCREHDVVDRVDRAAVGRALRAHVERGEARRRIVAGEREHLRVVDVERDLSR
ncbi:MAG TPA: hypothetical protein VGL61_17480 [Kofleriaceae bacterium]